MFRSVSAHCIHFHQPQHDTMPHQKAVEVKRESLSFFMPAYDLPDYYYKSFPVPYVKEIYTSNEFFLSVRDLLCFLGSVGTAALVPQISRNA